MRPLQCTNFRISLPPVIVIATALLARATDAAIDGQNVDEQFPLALVLIGSIVAASIIAIVMIVILRRADVALLIRDRALTAISSGVLITDHRKPDEPICFVNLAFTNITGFKSKECIGRNCRFLSKGVENDPQVLDNIRRCVDSGSSGVFELRNRTKDAQEFWNRLRLAPVTDKDGEVTHYVGIIDDVTNDRKQETRLQNALQEAEAANSMRDTFVRLIGHELRTPMNSALTWTRLLELDDSPETRSRGLNAIAQSVESQARLIDDLDDATRFSSVGVGLETKDVDAQKLLETTIDELRPTLDPKIELVVNIEPENYSANIDPLRVQQIIRNIISNANKYTAPGGRIEVELAVVDNDLVFTTRDTGKGLNKFQLTQIYKSFWRAESHKPGLGVGLYIVAALVEAHGGTIKAQSEGVGKGSTFTVRIPKRAAKSGRVTLN